MPRYVTRAAQAAAAFSSWLASEPAPLVTSLCHEEVIHAASWAVFVYPLYAALASACTSGAAGARRASAARASSKTGGASDSSGPPLIAKGLVVTVLTQGPPPQRPLPAAPSRSASNAGVYFLCRLDAVASVQEPQGDDGTEEQPQSVEPSSVQGSLELQLSPGALVALLLPSRAAARGPPSLEGARMTIAGSALVQRPQGGRDYSTDPCVLPAPLAPQAAGIRGRAEASAGVAATVVLEVSGYADLRIQPPSHFEPGRMSDEALAARSAHRAQRAGALAEGVDLESLGMMGEASAAAAGEGVGGDATGAGAAIAPSGGLAGVKRARDAASDDDGDGEGADPADTLIPAPPSAASATAAQSAVRTYASLYDKWEAQARRLAAAVLSCDKTACDLLRSALAPPSVAAATPTANSTTTAPARFSDAEVAHALAVAGKQLKFEAPSATCAHCLVQLDNDKEDAARMKDHAVVSVFHPKPAPEPEVPRVRPVCLADAVSLWKSLRKKIDPRSPALGDFALGPRECTRHWEVRLRAQGILRRVTTGKIETRYEGADHGEHAESIRIAAALLLEEFGGLSPEYFVKGSAEAAAAAEKIAARTLKPSANIGAAASEVAAERCGAGTERCGAGTEASVATAAVAMSAPKPSAKAKGKAKSAASLTLARAAAVRDFFAHVCSRVQEGVLPGSARAAATGVTVAPVATAAAAAATSTAVVPSPIEMSCFMPWWTAAERDADSAAFLADVASLLETGLRQMARAREELQPSALQVRSATFAAVCCN